MSTLTAHISRGALRRSVALAALALCTVATSLALPDKVTAQTRIRAHWAYGWPVKPFDHQHPVRGFFGDPRVGLGTDGSISRQFHFGVDISAPNNTPVYATLDGRVSIHPEHDDVVFVDGPSGVEFSYWHILPTVHTGDIVVAYETVVGRIEAPWGHVHFSEMRDNRYLNPLRAGAMGPYADPTRPTVSAVELERTGDAAHVARDAATGTFDIIAEVSDRTPLPVAAPWHDMPVMPALVRWRVVGPTGAVTGWQTAVDFRETIPAASAFASVFAKWTRQNHPNRPGRYRIYLAHGWNSAQVAPGRYRLEVSACDSRNNTDVAEFPLTLGSGR
jgi:murein DD-endopeptidase MepM/ murein hydrolase activator NlpD